MGTEIQVTGLPDLNLSGVGQASGGTYSDVILEGVARIHGDVSCERLLAKGVGRFNGNVTATTANVEGRAVFTGSLEAKNINLSGSIRTNGHCSSTEKLSIRGHADIGDCVNAREIEMEGKISVGSDIKADLVHITGHLKADKSFNAEQFVGTGKFVIGGMLNSDKIHLKIHGASSVQEIGGEQIRVERAPRCKLRWFTTQRLTVDTIEGDEIYLEYTTARRVCGNHVTLGPGVIVQTLEYKSALKSDHNARVRIVNQL